MRVEVGSGGKFLTAIDPATGKVAWRRRYPNPGGGGIGFLATAGGLLFGGDGSGNFVAHDAKDGKPLWHTRIGTISNAPQTYMHDGRQVHHHRHRRHAVGLYLVPTIGRFADWWIGRLFSE